ncbi:MAG: hypothetical protein CMJ78_23895 [Planctomycetaceae bacterium]|nr:hypothetical protein [Planctomycetaceae bacterium]
MPQAQQITTHCPPLKTLLSYASGSLMEDDAINLLEHLEICPRCQRQVDELTHREDSLLKAMRPTGLSEGGNKKPGQLQNLIDQACQPAMQFEFAQGKEKDKDRGSQNQKSESNNSPDEHVALDTFVSCLERSQLMHASEIEFLIEQIEPDDTDEFARELVKRQRLTSFQAKALRRGKFKGLVLGNYVVMEKLGQGGMGYVFKAKHRRMQRIVCIKVLHSSSRKSPEMAERFRREIQAVAALTHPNIVVAHDADETNGIPFLVMEFIDGPDLARHVEDEGPVSADEAWPLIMQTAKALDYAHEEGVIHRDIKPHNLILDKTGTIKILDMGLARFDSYLNQTPGEASMATMTHSGVVIGTIDYMSPEQALNCRHADERSDIYSLGCTLHFLLTGEPLFDGETIMERLIAHREDPIPNLTTLADDVSPEMNAVFQKMVAKDAEDRYQFMSELTKDLERLLDGEKTKAGREQARKREPQSSVDKVNRKPTPLPRLRKQKPEKSERKQSKREPKAEFDGRAETVSLVIDKTRLGAEAAVKSLKKVRVSRRFLIGTALVIAAYYGISWAMDGGLSSIRDRLPSAISDSLTDDSSAPDQQNWHPKTRVAGGPGRAMVVIPQGYFYEQHYVSLKQALQKRGVEVITASVGTGMAKPKHGKIKPVFINTTLQDYQPQNFDAVFLIDGNRGEFNYKNGECRCDTKSFIQNAINNGSPVATIGGAIEVVAKTGQANGRMPQKIKDVGILSSKDKNAGAILAVNDHWQAESLVHLIFDKQMFRRVN